MNAEPLLASVVRGLSQVHLEAVLIGNAAAALQGAPVTTVDFDFLFRPTRANIVKLKALARHLDATILRPFYPVSDLYRVVRDDGLQVDFMGAIHGIRSFEGLRDRATRLDVGGAPLLVAALADIVKSKKAGKRLNRRVALAAVARENERAVRLMIRRRLALPMSRRMNFLRVRIGPGRTAL